MSTRSAQKYRQSSWISSQSPSSKSQKGPHWTQSLSEAVIIAHPEGSLGLTIKGGADYGEFPYLGELKQENILYGQGFLQQDDLILDVQGQKVAGFTQRDVVLWLKHCSRNRTPVSLKCVKAGHLTKDLKEFLAGGFPKGSLDHELQNTIRDNLYMRTVPCTTRTPREGEINGQDYWFMTQDEFMELEKQGHLLESGLYTGNYYGTPKPPHEPLDKKAQSIADIVQPGAHPSSEGKRKRNRSNVEALSPGASTESTEDLLSVLAQKRAIQNGAPEMRNEMADSNGTGDGTMMARDAHRFVAPQMKQDGGLWGNIASQAVNKIRHHDSGHHSEDEHALRHEEELPYGWEKVDDPIYGTYYIDHNNKRTQYDHPQTPRVEVSSGSSGYTSSTFPRVKKRPPGSPESRVPKSASTHVALNGQRGGGRQILRPEDLRGDLMDVALNKSNRGLGFTIIGGEANQKFPDADFDEDDVTGMGTLLQLKSIAPGGPADLDGRLRSGDALVNINDRCVLGFTHDQVIELFQKIQPGELVRLRVCRGYPLPADATDPRAQIITTDAVSSAGNGVTSVGSSRPRMVETQRQSTTDTRTSIDTNDQEVAAAFFDQQPVASGPLYKLQITKGSSGFGFTIAESPDGQTIKKIVDKKRCQGLLEGDLLVEINNRVVRGLDHTSVVEVFKEAPIDEPSVFVVQRAQRIEGRKEQRASRVLGRSKTPTADMYKSHTNTSSTEISHPKKQRSKTPTPRPSSSSFFGFFRSKTPKPVKENVQEAVTSTSTSNTVVYEKPTKTTETVVKTDTRSPDKAVSPAPQSQDADFKRNQFAYSSMTRMVTPSYIPASQYTKKNEEKMQNQAFVSNAVPEWNRADSTSTMYARVQKPVEPPTAVAHPVRINGMDNRPSKLRLNGPSFENSSLASIPSSTAIDGDNESQLHSPPGSIDLIVTLRREDAGFGFRIVGGTEEGSQVAVGYVVPGGAAEKDGRLEVGDEIVNIDGVSVMNASHSQVIQMMQKSSLNGFVVLGVRRRINYAPANVAREITIHRQPNEGFGFVIISSIARNQQLGNGTAVNGGSAPIINYPILGRILDNSPAERCGELHVGDKILAVNGIDVLHLHHSEIVQMIKESGTSVMLTIMSQASGLPDDASTVSANSQQRFDEFYRQEAEGAFVPYSPQPTGANSKVEYILIELERATRGFGFSIRGGKEFHMPLFVLRIAENGPAADDGRLRVGDEIIEINGISTKDFTHGEAIELIQRGGTLVRLLIRRNSATGMVSPTHGQQQLGMSVPQSGSNHSMSGVVSRQYIDAGSYGNYSSSSNLPYNTSATYRASPSTQTYPTQGAYQTHLQSTNVAFQARPYYFGSSGK
ncbi:membrane-associated guanylate kinase, WW and PDZ domain-containing protein 3-like isoform X2 [Paramacrobiotus metropolitanus]|uniref:membrane-associated guanylate kinase, WW and PDZ domain-containing protein 3-like isoform X2 n=1 Tax=Paramacrobiotus metropolitanus TaxID=2943436 RepID=UPI002445D24E|nr:membrane-associated guanylate kinase, WW and PDZ domain-containing protein 3-like isoform X2 [Paramacrobiotus metropolitanus]